MKLTVLGAGNVGQALARAGLEAGHEVTITANDPEHARSAAEGVGATAGASNGDAVSNADIVVLAVPYGALDALAAEIADVARGIVIDVTNPVNADFTGLAVSDRAGAEVVAEKLPRASVVKAFNTVFAANMAEPVVDGTALDGFYAGDDAAAKAQVSELLAAVGYNPCDVGGLHAALALEHMAFLNMALNAGHGWSWRSGWRLVGPRG